MTDNQELSIMSDDGSLAFLNIPPMKNDRQLTGMTTTQSKLVNTSFWVFGFIENVETKFTKQKGTEGQTLVQIRPAKNSPESDSQKFFTGSDQILYVLHQIQERNAFPRKVTLKSFGNRYYFE